MTHITIAPRRSAASRLGLDGALAAALTLASRAGDRLAREWRYFRDARRLQALSDAALQDIGLSRSEIDWAVRNGRDA